MGRWKDNGQGQAYYDANDSGPDQIAPPNIQAMPTERPVEAGPSRQTTDPNAPGYDPGVGGTRKGPIEIGPPVDPAGPWQKFPNADDQTFGKGNATIEEIIKSMRDRWAMGQANDASVGSTSGSASIPRFSMPSKGGFDLGKLGLNQAGPVRTQ